jgi:phage shock protein C
MMMPQAKLMRSREDRFFGGVCGGIAAYLGVDTVFVRLAFVLLIFASGVGLLLYLILLVLMPVEVGTEERSIRILRDNPDGLQEEVEDGLKRAQQHPQGPTIAAVVLILLGVYFLLSNVGWFGWFNLVFWPVMIIGLGVYLLARRGR